jgi:2-polyprenyl-3-methyl-5-hydroxy-6-metoxy-1,4-benzoquinol methylase
MKNKNFTDHTFMNKELSFEMQEIINCRACESTNFKFIGMRGGKYQRWGLGIESPIYKCKNCSLLFPNPFPVPQSLESIYGHPDEYFSKKGDWLLRVDDLTPVVEEFIDRLSDPASCKILDIGSGRGEFVGACKKFKHIEITGLEVSEASIAFAKEKGIDLTNKTLLDLIQEGKVYDGICLSAVIEHVHEPGEFVKEVSQLLKPGGILYIDCPREPNLLTIIGNFANKILFKDGIYNLQPTWKPFHVFGFNPKSLEMILAKNSIEIHQLKASAKVEVRSSGQVIDRMISLVAVLVKIIANYTGLASNLYVWAKKSK